MAGGLIAGLAGAMAPIGPASAAPVDAVTASAQASVAAIAGPASATSVRSRPSTAALVDLAGAVAAAAGVDAAAVLADWQAASPVQVAAGLTALAQVGVRYRRLGGSPSEGFDCSGLTSWAWSAAGVTLGRSSGEQLSAAGHGRAEAMVGDLVGYPGHVMLYVGGGAVVHAPYTGRDVEVIPLRRHVDHFVTPAIGDLPDRNVSVMTRVRAF